MGSLEESRRITIGDLHKDRVAGTIDTIDVLEVIVCTLQGQGIDGGTEPDRYYASAGQLWHDGWHGWLCVLVNHQWIVDTDLPCCGIEDRGLDEGCLVRVGLVTWAIGGFRGQQFIWWCQSLRPKPRRGYDQGTNPI